MYDPNDFNQNNQEQADFQDNRPEDNDNGAANEPPRWYSVSYRDAYGDQSSPVVTPIDEQRPYRARRYRKVAIIAAIVAACILFSALAGFGGAFFAQHFLGDRLPDDPEQGSAGDTPPSVDNQSGISGSSNGLIYDFNDQNYDFPSALQEITKNSDAALIGHANGSAGDAKKSLIEVTAAVKDSVVEITTTTVSNRGTISAGAGSGVIIHEDGIIVTNNHVIENCDNIYVRLTNGDTYEAALRGTNEDGDIALLKITPQAGKPLTVAKLGYSKALALGEEVVAIGNPLGELGGTVTNGIISATEREINVDGVTMTLLQTNAAINSGNSGGGLFNMAGELIGVVNAKYSAAGVEGLGFAIPIDSAFEDSFRDLLAYGYIRGIPSLGLTLVEHTGGNFLNVVYGAYVYDVGTQAAFRVGDYIYSIDGTKVYGTSTSAVAAIRNIVRSHRVGDTVSVVVLRDEQQVTLSVVLQEYVPTESSLNIQE